MQQPNVPPRAAMTARRVPAAIVEPAMHWPVMVHAYQKTPKSVTFVATNLGRDTVRGFSGVVRVFDSIGNEVVDINVADTKPIPSQKSVYVVDPIAPNQGNDLESFFVRTDNKNLIYVYIPQRVEDKNGVVHYVRAVSPTTR